MVNNIYTYKMAIALFLSHYQCRELHLSSSSWVESDFVIATFTFSNCWLKIPPVEHCFYFVLSVMPGVLDRFSQCSLPPLSFSWLYLLVTQKMFVCILLPLPKWNLLCGTCVFWGNFSFFCYSLSLSPRTTQPQRWIFLLVQYHHQWHTISFSHSL
jgi:hypothetical protein